MNQPVQSEIFAGKIRNYFFLSPSFTYNIQNTIGTFWLLEAMQRY